MQLINLIIIQTYAMVFIKVFVLYSQHEFNFLFQMCIMRVVLSLFKFKAMIGFKQMRFIVFHIEVFKIHRFYLDRLTQNLKNFIFFILPTNKVFVISFRMKDIFESIIKILLRKQSSFFIPKMPTFII